MSGFAINWLDLREPADARARNTRMLADFATALPANPRIIDLGSGTGSTARTISAAVPNARWTLVDHDPALLAEAARRHPDATIRQADLATDIETVLTAEAHAITASALFDLVSEDWITRFARAAKGRIVYAALSYDGLEAWNPPHEDDDTVARAFNTHQRRDKGFGPACGPLGASKLAQALEAQGYTVTIAPSPWRLNRETGDALMTALATGVAGAAEEEGCDASAWLTARHTANTCEIGHLDLLAIPV